MKTRTLLIGLLLTLSGAASAHHSTAIYDNENPVQLTGTVKEWRFTNPHCLIVLEVAGDAGETEVWTLEGSNTSLLIRRGWTPLTLEPGDRITVTVRPLRSGVTGGNYGNVRWEDGTPVNPRDGE